MRKKTSSITGLTLAFALLGLGLVHFSFGIATCFADDTHGRTSDGRAFRKDAEGNTVVDYIAELESENDSLKRQVKGVESERDAAELKLTSQSSGSAVGCQLPLKEKNLLEAPTAGGGTSAAAPVVVQYQKASTCPECKACPAPVVAQAIAECPKVNCPTQTCPTQSCPVQACPVKECPAKDCSGEIQRASAQITSELTSKHNGDANSLNQKLQQAELNLITANQKLSATQQELSSANEKNASLTQRVADQENQNKSLQAQLVSISELKASSEKELRQVRASYRPEPQAAPQLPSAKAEVIQPAARNVIEPVAAVVAPAPAPRLPELRQERELRHEVDELASDRGVVLTEINKTSSLIANRDALYQQYKQRPSAVSFTPAGNFSSRGYSLEMLKEKVNEAQSTRELSTIRREVFDLRGKIDFDIGMMKRLSAMSR